MVTYEHNLTPNETPHKTLKDSSLVSFVGTMAGCCFRFSLYCLLIGNFFIAASVWSVEDEQPSRHRPVRSQSKLDWPQDALFFDSLTEPFLKPWRWIRENADAHRQSEKGLEIKIQPGGLMGGGCDAKNVFIRTLPRAAKLVSVFVDADHKSQFEQAGLIVYRDDDNYTKLVMEMVDEKKWIVLVVEIDAAARVINKVPAPEKGGVWIGMELDGDNLVGHCWIMEGEKVGNHQEVGRSEFPIAVSQGRPRPRIGVFTQSGQADADRWARFRDFGRL